MRRMKTVEFKRTGVTVGLMTLLWLLSTLTILAPSHAAIFFDSDFETCSVGTSSDFPCEGWNDFGQANPGHLEVSTDQAFSGTKSVKGTWDNIAGSSQQPSIHHTFPGSTHLFARFAMRVSPGFGRSTNGNTKLVRFKSLNGYPLLWINYYYGNYMVGMEVPYDRAGGYLLTTNVAPSQTSWDQVELEYKLNTPGESNGILRLWVNGTLRIEHLGHAYIGPTPTSRCAYDVFVCSSELRIENAQIFIQSGLGNIYYDRFAVGDTRIGPMQPKSTSADSTPPASPQGLQAR